MAEELPVVQLIIDILKTFILVHVEIVRAIIRWFVPPELKDVTGEIVLITGTGHGMGREMALRFARLGAKVVCVDVNPTSNEETWKMIHDEKGKAYKYTCDVTNREAVFQMADRIRREVGEVTYLVNNAGIMPCKPLLQQTEMEIRTMMDINVNGCMWMIQAFLPSMIERNHGHIVAMSSLAGLISLKNLTSYCGSKFAVRGTMSALFFELQDDPRNVKGVKLTTVYPYMVNTGLCQKPRVKFPSFMKLVEPEEAADQIIDGVRRNYNEICVPGYVHYIIRYVLNPLPISAVKLLYDFMDTGVDPHD